MREDILTAISKEKNVNSVIVLTHNIDFIFIQTVVLKHLKKIGNPSLTIFADAQCVEESYEHQKLIISGLGKRYRVVPVSLDRSYDRFHPKAVLLSSQDKASLFVGSGNLTFGGWRQNAEIWNSYKTEEDETAIFNAFKGYLDSLINRLPYTKNIAHSVDSAYDKDTALWASQMEEAAGLIGKINHENSLLKQMKPFVESGCERLVIQSPYFDKAGKTIEQLNEAFSPQKVQLFAQDGHSELTQEIISSLSSNVSIIPTDFTHYALDKAKKAFMHAKFYAFVYSDKVIVFSGSANCSQAALAMDGTVHGNAELMSVREMPVEDFNAQFINDIETDVEFAPKTQKEVEESYDERLVQKPVQLHSAQYEYKHIKVAYKLGDSYEIIGCKVDEEPYRIRFIDEGLLHIEECNREPSRLCLLLKDRESGESLYSNEIWIDHEHDLSTSAKTRSLSDFIQSSNDLSWNHSAFGELLKVFNEHLSHAPKRADAHTLGEKRDDSQTRTLFNPSDVFVDSYDFTSMHTELSGRYSFDINAILRQYLGINSLYGEADTVKEVPTQEELEEQLDDDTLQLGDTVQEKQITQKTELKPNDRKKIQKLIATLVEAFINKEIIENRPLPLLLDDLKVASIILRMGLDKEWITSEEYFDATYTLWTEFFFSCELDETRGYLDFKLTQEDIEIEDLKSATLSATMLTWLFSVEPSTNIKYIRLIMSAILVHANYPWIFIGGDPDAINTEVNKALAVFQVENIEQSLKGHQRLWELILKTGSAFSELIEKSSDFKSSDIKDKIPEQEIKKGDLFWQRKADGVVEFYLAGLKFNRLKLNKKGYQVEMYSLNNKEHIKNYYVEYTIPVRSLLQIDGIDISTNTSTRIMKFIDLYLLNVTTEQENI